MHFTIYIYNTFCSINTFYYINISLSVIKIRKIFKNEIYIYFTFIEILKIYSKVKQAVIDKSFGEL